MQSTREAIFGTTTNAALRLTEEDAEDWMRFLRFAIAFHLEAETRRAEEEPEPLKVRRSFGLLYPCLYDIHVHHVDQHTIFGPPCFCFVFRTRSNVCVTRVRTHTRVRTLTIWMMTS